MRFRDAAEQAREAAIAMGQFHLFEDVRYALVEHRDAVTTSGLFQSAAKPGFTDTTGAGDDQVALVSGPFSGEQALEQRIIEAAPGGVIDILQTGAYMAQSGRAHARVAPRDATRSVLRALQVAVISALMLAEICTAALPRLPTPPRISTRSQLRT